MVYVIATVRTHPGKRSQVLEHFARVVPQVLQEQGCGGYAPSVDLATNIDAQGELREDVITVVEQWESVEALEAHLVAPHMIEFRKAVQELVESVALQIVEPA